MFKLEQKNITFQQKNISRQLPSENDNMIFKTDCVKILHCDNYDKTMIKMSVV